MPGTWTGLTGLTGLRKVFHTVLRERSVVQSSVLNMEVRMQPIYLDYNATTPTDPAVIEELVPYLAEVFGNPSAAILTGKRPGRR